MSTMYRTTDPETSRMAAESLPLDFQKSARKAVIEFFTAKQEATDAELEIELGAAFPGFSTLRKRGSELTAGGLLYDTGRTKANPRNGRQMVVWAVKP